MYSEGHRLGKRSITRAEAWTLRLLPFSFTIKRVPGHENIADSFSRLIEETLETEPFDDSHTDHIMFTSDESVCPLTYEEIAEFSSLDETLCKVRDALSTNAWSPDLKRFHAVKSELYLIGDVIVFRDKYVDKSYAARLLESHIAVILACRQ